jgi:hypothetical protein
MWFAASAVDSAIKMILRGLKLVIKGLRLLKGLGRYELQRVLDEVTAII